ncbi:putative haloacid dehalogenase-like hydrolase [Aspergillus clavatus NRRL 1]|uniref:Haloacid dehalogenase-like hydrolase, putative n=1 Tax=Aspergillus clavatus (strain ATCC 1007 / CBS 513.65 / DSM 816 / NCTC 3887 / NRRL 1 / QM 1276 / 107) TaxID=344612 RepID=A1CFE5_ASPCL|nr:haloacid dehalogenase-like hydrolase, putative [Aspergillus clavatus NRRL 1]EAW11594.1 haloacid dehalogenase-like hydrolase, putative [Aspergillus clavatus NRRL 1]
MASRRPRTLLLTLDAFDTIFHPRQPVPEQYAAAADAFGLPRSTITPERLAAAFKSTFKAQSKAYPNYGREYVLRGQYGGPRQWWEEVIRGSFSRAMTGDSEQFGVNNEIPPALVTYLVERFASSEGYALFDDVEPFLAAVREIKSRKRGSVFDRVLLGVISNSDDRVPAVLKSLGLRVGHVRADQGVESRRLPGFETDGAVGSPSRSKDGDEQVRQVDDVDLVITSYEAGEEKPSRVIFDVARRQAQRLAHGADDADSDWVCMHVGDDVDKDYHAALSVGWDGYYIPRGDTAHDTHGVKTIHSLLDLIPTIETYR